MTEHNPAARRESSSDDPAPVPFVRFQLAPVESVDVRAAVHAHEFPASGGVAQGTVVAIAQTKFGRQQNPVRRGD